ncbi:MAG: amino acid dehydrogenase [Bacteroidota bacterium]|nr:amino acid dehydrogenase [Bacteroidota bacterium]
MKSPLADYLNKKPIIVFEWKDTESEAEGWLVINSLKGGAAGGGTRMREGLTKDEVLSLAKVMEVKFNVCGPSIGGAKSGINFNPEDPRKLDVLKRWYQAISPFLKSYYGTGGDLNVDEVKDVFPITSSLGILHPQEGVLKGHFGYDFQKQKDILNQLNVGCNLHVIHPDYAVSIDPVYKIPDMVTGYGVYESVEQFYNLFHQENLNGKRIVIQGWGNVGAAAGFYFAKNGAKVVGILDKEYGILSSEGFSLERIKEMFIGRDENRLNDEDMRPMEEIKTTMYSYEPEIFIPAAASRLVDSYAADRWVQAGVKMISCGANVPFHEDRIIFGELSQRLDRVLTVIPDFIANCGMARAFHYLMIEGAELEDYRIFEDIRDTMKRLLFQLHEKSNSPNFITERSLDIFLEL